MPSRSPVSHLYGFGLLDAESMVKEAEGWRVAPQHHVCEEEAPVQLNGWVDMAMMTNPRGSDGCLWSENPNECGAG